MLRGWWILLVLGCNDPRLLGSGHSPDASDASDASDGGDASTADGSPDGAMPGIDADNSSITDPSARLIAPMSTSTVSQRWPILHWVLAPGMTNPVVDLCTDRACTQPLAPATVLNDHSARPSALLPPGWIFWRVRATDGAGTFTSATWQFFVMNRLAWGTNMPNTSGGSAFDVNGDGYTDLLIGAGDASAAYIYLGNSTGTSLTRIDLINPDGLTGSGCNNSGTCFGGTVGNVGDINGDGFGDFVIHSWVTPTTPNAGNVHVYFGGPNPDASEWNGTAPSKRIDLIRQTSRLGSIAAIGDVNADGYGDFISMGTKYGWAGLYYGSPAPTAARWTGWSSTTSPVDAISLVTPDSGYSNYQAFGPAAGVGDVNGDGYSDFLMGAPAYASNIHFSFAHLYYGGPNTGAATWNGGGATRRVDLVTQESDVSFGGSFGASVAGVGDVNGDGYSEFLVGAPEGFSYKGGHAHLYFGGANLTAIDWNGTQYHRTDLEPPDGENYYGWAASPAGDVNGDGLADFVVGAANDQNLMLLGAAHLYVGGESNRVWFGATASMRFDLASPDGPDGYFATVVAGGGDVDRNGYSDFLICAPRANSLTGVCHLDFGSTSPSASNWNGTTAPARLDLVPPTGGGFGGAAN